MTKRQKPTVGRIVHYYEPGRALPRAAIIVAADDEEYPGIADLHVFDPFGEGDYYVGYVRFCEEPEDGRWTWPPRD